MPRQLGLVPRGLLQARMPSRGLCPPDIVNAERRLVSAIHVHNLPIPPFCEPTRICCSEVLWSFSCPGGLWGEPAQSWFCPVASVPRVEFAGSLSCSRAPPSPTGRPSSLLEQTDVQWGQGFLPFCPCDCELPPVLPCLPAGTSAKVTVESDSEAESTNYILSLSRLGLYPA